MWCGALCPPLPPRRAPGHHPPPVPPPALCNPCSPSQTCPTLHTLWMVQAGAAEIHLQLQEAQQKIQSMAAENRDLHNQLAGKQEVHLHCLVHPPGGPPAPCCCASVGPAPIPAASDRGVAWHTASAWQPSCLSSPEGSAAPAACRGLLPWGVCATASTGVAAHGLGHKGPRPEETGHGAVCTAEGGGGGGREQGMSLGRAVHHVHSPPQHLHGSRLLTCTPAAHHLPSHGPCASLLPSLNSVPHLRTWHRWRMIPTGKSLSFWRTLARPRSTTTHCRAPSTRCAKRSLSCTRSCRMLRCVPPPAPCTTSRRFPLSCASGGGPLRWD